MDISLDGRTVVVTGGTGFLGSAVTQALLDAGAACHVTYVTEKERERFTLGQRVGVHRVNCENEQEVAEFYESLGEVWGSVHTVGGFAMASVEKTSAEQMLQMFGVNAMTCFLCCREGAKAMRKSGRGGRIVNVAARPAVTPVGGMIAYSTSKAAVASITQCLGEELKAEGILVNAVVPSIMDTAANRRAMPDADFSKWPTVQQVAQAIVFLASPGNALTSGALLPVYGKA